MPMAENHLKRQIFFLEIADTIIEIAVMLIAFIGLQYFVVSPFVVSGASMETSLHDQEIILVNRLGHSKHILQGSTELERGDVVVFRPPIDTDEYYIKRIIGVPGDTIRFSDNTVFINDLQVTEPYTNCSRNESLTDFPSANTRPCTYTIVEGKTFVVPDGRYFVMGDNRDRSSDSRTCFLPAGDSHCTETTSSHFVPYENVVGKAWVVLWPFSSKASRTHDDAFFDKVWPIDNIKSIEPHDPLSTQ